MQHETACRPRVDFERVERDPQRREAAGNRRPGARKVELDSKEAFAAACVAGRGDDARAFLRRDPKLLEGLGLHGRTELVHKAVEARRPEAVRLMAELGFESSTVTCNRPLHDAAWAGALERVKLLLELGADPGVRDRSCNATPLGWAEHNGQREVAEYLAELATTSGTVENDGG